MHTLPCPSYPLQLCRPAPCRLSLHDIRMEVGMLTQLRAHELRDILAFPLRRTERIALHRFSQTGSEAPHALMTAGFWEAARAMSSYTACTESPIFAAFSGQRAPLPLSSTDLLLYNGFLGSPGLRSDVRDYSARSRSDARCPHQPHRRMMCLFDCLPRHTLLFTARSMQSF